MNKDIDLVNDKLNQTLNVCAKDNSNKMDENILEREKSFQSELS